MPKRTDIFSFFIIDTGPIVIGAAEFDHSGTQASKVPSGPRLGAGTFMPGAGTSGPDRAGLAILDDMSDCAHIPRPFHLYLYGGHDALSALAPALAALGWTDTEPRRSNNEWAIIAERIQPATDEAVAAMSAEIERLVAGTDVKFDGWETEIVKAN